MSGGRPVRTPKIAEGLVEYACQAAGAVVNRAHDDQFGWDLIVQMDGPRVGGRPADLDPAGLTSLVQVKSTTTKRRACRLKLSNAVRLAKEASPCFVALLAFDKGAAQPCEVFLRHIWQEEISDALKAARLAHIEGHVDLHRVPHTLAFTDADRCPLSEVPHRIEASVTAFGNGYSSEKAKLVQSVGYEDGYGDGWFTLADEVDPNTFIDMMLGRVADVPISAIEVQDKRFGLPGPWLVPNRAGRISVTPEPKEQCLVVVGPSDGSDQITLDGEVFIPGIPNLPEDLLRFRVQTAVLEVIVWPGGSSSLNASFQGDHSFDIGTIAQLASLWSWIGAGSLKLEIFVRGRSLGQCRVDLPKKPADARWPRLKQAVRDLLDLVPPNRWPAEVRFRVSDMFAGLAHLERVAMQISRAGVSVELENIAPNFETLMAGCERYLAPVYLDFGDVTLFALIEAPVETVTVAGTNASVVLGKPQIVNRAVLPGDAKANLNFMESLLAVARKERGGRGFMFGSLPTIHELRAS
jgi:hypothetical protein